MNHQYTTSWWASEGDGPLGRGPDNPQLNRKMMILKSLCENRPLYAVEKRYGGTKYGKVEVKDGTIYINSFKLKEPDSSPETRFISFPELLSRFNNGSTELPKFVFLRGAPDCDDNYFKGDVADSFEVVIKTEELSLRAMNYILLCSALKGPSYKDSKITGFPSRCFHSASPTPRVIEGINEDGDKAPLKEGGVYGIRHGNSQFVIQLVDNSANIVPKFGDIVVGLQRIKDLQSNYYSIKECGLVILPQ